MTAVESSAHRSRFSRLGYWIAEPALVFLGVSSAFWLNNYQQHQAEAKRRDQILASLEQRLQDGISHKNGRCESGTAGC